MGGSACGRKSGDSRGPGPAPDLPAAGGQAGRPGAMLAAKRLPAIKLCCTVVCTSTTVKLLPTCFSLQKWKDLQEIFKQCVTIYQAPVVNQKLCILCSFKSFHSKIDVSPNT